jgi:hypothetical protein
MDKRCRITSGGREPRESATENEPPRSVAFAAARVKRCGKSAPRRRQRRRQGKPHREQDRIGTARGFGAQAQRPQADVWSRRPGRLLEAPGNRRPRGMAVAHVNLSSHAIQNPAYRLTDAYLRASGGIPPDARQVSVGRLLLERLGMAIE